MTNEIQIKVPDIGGASGVEVIEVMVKAGDAISKDTPLITLESDKASMEIPSPASGIVNHVILKVGDKVSEGDVIMAVSVVSELQEPSLFATPVPVENETVENKQPVMPVENGANSPSADEILSAVIPLVSEKIINKKNSIVISAGPAVRRMARELGVDISLVQGSGRKERVSKEDVQNYVKHQLSAPGLGNLSASSFAPVIDFSQFGDIEKKPLNKIKKLTGVNVHRSWVTIPHVTQFDEADITELERFRKSESEKANQSGYKLTILAFVCRVVSKALQIYPQFNASLDANGEQLIFKKYCHMGIAVETSNGLVVPVIKNVNHLSISEIAAEMAKLSTKAREKGLTPAEMSGGCFTISSLGGIGGTAFTPIVNSPEVAILGLSRATVKPAYIENEWVPRLMLPLSLSYDHRVIDGAEAARFTRYVSEALSDIRRILL